MKKTIIRVHWSKKTNAGRIVYDREPHKFTQKDVIRIMNKILIQEQARPTSDLISTLKNILNAATDGMISVISKALFLPDIFTPQEIRTAGIEAIDHVLEALGLNPYVLEEKLLPDEELTISGDEISLYDKELEEGENGDESE